jgi:hypothetical protein
VLVQETALPAAPQDITAQWLTHALGREVAAVEFPEVVWGTATKVRLDVTYAQEPPDGAAPRALCAKGGFDERLSDWGLGPAYVREARFFGDLAARFGGVPRCWFAGIDPARGQGVVLLDDLVATDCSFGDPTAPWTADEVAAALEVMAGWHAQTAGVPSGLPDWLEVGSSAPRGTASMFLSRDHWDRHFAQEGAPVLPASLQDPDRILQAFQRLWADDDAAPHSVVHGDAHIGNTYREAKGRPGFLDWQTVCLGPWAYDVAYFIGGALSVVDRREHERSLLSGYLGALATAGGPAVSMDDAWPDYVRHTLHGFLWAATPAIMQSLERVVAMAERYAAAIEDHDTLAVLGAR